MFYNSGNSNAKYVQLRKRKKIKRLKNTLKH